MFNHCLFFNLSALNRQINRIWQEEFQKLGLSPSHGYLLYLMVEQPHASQKELGELMELDASTITRFVDALEKKGLIRKDNRGKGASFTITLMGKKQHKKIEQTMDRLYKTMQRHFGKNAFTQLVDDLYRARQSFKENHA